MPAPTRWSWSSLALMAAIQCACPAALAADSSAYPVRPVRMVVPFAPGGGSDIVGRIVAHGLTEQWGQAVVVDNRPGAGSTIGTTLASKAPADGYSVLVSSSAIAFSPSLYKDLPFDIQRDFRPVSLLARQPSLLVVAQAVKATSITQLLQLARAQPGKLTFGSAGIGSATHLGGELLRSMAKIEMLHVPYKSAGLAMTALLGGEVDVLVTNMATVLPHVQSGKVHTLGITSRTRSALAPDIPTLAENGLPSFEYDTWYGMLVPAATPHGTVDRLYRETHKVMHSARMQQQLTAQGIDIVMSAPATFADFLAAELSKWSGVIRVAGLQQQ